MQVTEKIEAKRVALALSLSKVVVVSWRAVEGMLDRDELCCHIECFVNPFLPLKQLHVCTFFNTFATSHSFQRNIPSGLRGGVPRLHQNSVGRETNKLQVNMNTYSMLVCCKQIHVDRLSSQH